MLLEWFVFYTYPKSEKFLLNELSKVNYDVYLPLQKVDRQWKDRKTVIDVPLFPNYIFVRTLKKNIYQILNHPRIVKYVSFDGRPATLKEEEVELIKTVSTCGNILGVSQLNRGDKIRIRNGLLKGYEGILVECEGKKQLGFQLKEMKHTILIDFDSVKFEKVEV